jgi:hypothetical protein
MLLKQLDDELPPMFCRLVRVCDHHQLQRAHGGIAGYTNIDSKMVLFFHGMNLTRLQSISDEHTVWYGLDLAMFEIMCPCTSLAPAIKAPKSALTSRKRYTDALRIRE